MTGVPDEKKGEKLIVLYTIPEETAAETQEKLSSADIPNLWKPKKDQFFHIESLPYLGTGKLDLRKVRELANALSQGN